MSDTLTKMDGASKNLVAERLEALKQILPEAFAEGKIDFDALRDALGDAVASDKENYRFVWNGKEEARAFALRPSLGTLRPCPEESKNWDTTQNLYIEGDNLEVLKLLQGSYYGRVKMIYIDPPYNTGKDFVYSDNFKDSIRNYKEITGQIDAEGRVLRANTEISGRYHTDWLNMMFPRLLLARNLLDDDGVIFISIDDNEAANLRKLCDEVFGENNYMNQFAWVVNITGRQISGSGAAKTWESVFVYAKNIDNIDLLSIDTAFAKEKMPDAYKGFDKDIRQDDHGPFAVGDTLYNHNRKYNEETRRNMVFSIFYNPTTEEIKTGDIGEKKDGFVEILPHKNGDGIHKYHAWRWSRQKIENESYNLIVELTPSGKYEIYTRIRDFSNTTLKDLITNISNGDSELQTLFGKKYFNYPKSLDLLITLLGSILDKEAIVLDFFSGSATTAHAVMQLNAQDGGKRKYIMVQLPENLDLAAMNADASEKLVAKNAIELCDKLCVPHQLTEVGKERIRLAGENIMKANATTAPNLDIGFKVFKLDTSNLIPWNPNPENLEASLFAAVQNMVEGRTIDDLLYEVLLKCNLPLTLSIKKETFGENTINVIGEGALMICLDKKITAAVAEEMIRLRDEVYKPAVPMRVVFLDNGFDDKEKANAIATLKQAQVEEKAIMSI